MDAHQWQNPLCHDESVCPNAGYGLLVRLRHTQEGHDMYTYYAHLSVAKQILIGTVIRKGEWIGTSGSSGNSSGPHLHFEVTHGTSWGNTVNSINPDSPTLWDDGEWTGSNAATSVPARRFPEIGFVAENIIDDEPNNVNGFSKGCNAGGSCPYWWRVTTSGYNNDYLWTMDNTFVPDYGEWSLQSPPATSNYRLSIYVPCGQGPNDNSHFASWQAPYTVYHQDGQTQVMVVTLPWAQSILSERLFRPQRQCVTVLPCLGHTADNPITLCRCALLTPQERTVQCEISAQTRVNSHV